MDFLSGTKNIGSSAFGSSSGSGSSGAGSSSGSGGGGIFSNFFNLSIQKMVLILAIIAFIISVGTVAILLLKSKNSQKWPPEIAKCPDRMELDSTGKKCVDPYGLGVPDIVPNMDNCANFRDNMSKRYSGAGLAGIDGGYIPWEGIFDSQNSRAASLKCLS